MIRDEKTIIFFGETQLTHASRVSTESKKSGNTTTLKSSFPCSIAMPRKFAPAASANPSPSLAFVVPSKPPLCFCVFCVFCVFVFLMFLCFVFLSYLCFLCFYFIFLFGHSNNNRCFNIRCNVNTCCCR